MRSSSKIIQNPLTAGRDSRDRVALRELFPELTDVHDERVLALRPYLTDRPERFFDRQIYQHLIAWLFACDAGQRKNLRTYFEVVEADVNRAFLFLREINGACWHDHIEDSGGEFDLVRFIDQTLHPVYLRLVEGVLIPLVRVVAHFARLDRNVGTDGLDVWPIVEELRRDRNGILVASYHHLIRNGIAHGGVTYLQNEIRFRDKRKNEVTLDNREVIRAVDDLVDACNGIAAALKTFFISVRTCGYRIPREFLVEELREETKTRWWSVEGCVEAEIGGRSQLVVYTRTSSRDFNKVQFSAIQTGLLAESLVPGYNRYFLSLRSSVGWPGWVGFDGDRLKKVRESNPSDIRAYRGVIENDVVFYVPRRPLKWLGQKLDTFRQTLAAIWPGTVQEYRDRLDIPLILVRTAKIHRNAWGIVLNGSVVIEGLEDKEAHGVVHRFRRRIIRVALRAATPATGSIPLLRYFADRLRSCLCLPQRLPVPPSVELRIGA